MKLSRVSRKDCRKYLRLEYELPVHIDQEFVNKLKFLGDPEYVRFSNFSEVSNDLFRIRNYALSLELSGTYNDRLLSATYRVKDEDIISYLEDEILAILPINLQ